MLSYLQKFNDLPKEIQAAVTSPEVAARIVELGKTYGLDLATTVMKVMVKEIPLDGLSAYFVNQNNLALDKSQLLEKDLRKYVFANVLDYLLGAGAKPKLVFSEDDEKEVKAIARSVETFDFDQIIEAAATRVFEKSRINFTDPLLKAKFHQVIKTYLRLTRDKIATAEALTKASELGGIGLSNDAVDRAMSWAEIEFNELKKISTSAQVKIPVPEDGVGMQSKEEIKSPFKRVVQEVDYNLEASLRAEGKLKPMESKIIEADHELAPPVPVVLKKQAETIEKVVVPSPVINPPTPPEARKIIKDAINSNQPIAKPDLQRLTKETKAPEPIVNLKVSSTGKIKMDDIHFTPQVLSPVDELRYMSLKTFRRLNPDPLKATESIKEKLEYLGRSDYAKKIEGIVAWQESPLNKLYLSICRQALSQGKPVTDVLREQLQAEPSFLKPEELSAIIALNHLLKF